MFEDLLANSVPLEQLERQELGVRTTPSVFDLPMGSQVRITVKPDMRNCLADVLYCGQILTIGENYRLLDAAGHGWCLTHHEWRFEASVEIAGNR